MKHEFAITDEQRKILGSFSCERLSEKDINFFNIFMRFKSKRGAGLVANLRENGWMEDSSGSTAYYLIKDPKGDILLFFSLKCGVLFDPDFFREFMSAFNRESTMDIWREFLTEDEIAKLDGICTRDPRTLWYDCIYAKDEVATESIDAVKDLIGDERFDFMENILKLHARISNEKKSEPNLKIIRVPESHSAIELVEFCANDLTKGSWNKYDMGGNRMGETLFWFFVVEKMLEINKLVGSEYAFLFAADKKADGSLVNYYRSAFHFQSMPHLGTIKPGYDLGCFFLGSRLRTVPVEYRADDAEPEDYLGLDYYQKEFFDNFNKNAYAEDFV